MGLLVERLTDDLYNMMYISNFKRLNSKEDLYETLSYLNYAFCCVDRM